MTAGGGAEREDYRAGSLTWDSIPGPGGHDPSQRQTLHRPSLPDTPRMTLLLLQILTSVLPRGDIHAVH